MGCAKSSSANVIEAKVVSSSNCKVNPARFIVQGEGNVHDHYVLGAKIGVGQFGTVRLATHKHLGHRRAVKSLLKSKLRRSASGQSTLASEVEALKKIDHPNAVKLFEYFEDERCFHLILELVEGGDLFEFLLKQSVLSEPVTAALVKQLFSALAHCHSQGIVHRDIKPENLLLDASHQTLKLSGFGGATISGVAPTLLTVKGTVLYLAPETLSGQSTAKSDMWSCGVLLYILLTGRPPFFAMNKDDLGLKITSGKFCRNVKEWTGLSSEAQSLVSQLLTVSSDQRISAEEALHHPWFASFSTDSSTPASPARAPVLNNLRQFCVSHKLQQAVITYIASQWLAQEDFQALSRAFQALDKNSDGKLSREELLAGYIKVFGTEHMDVEEILKKVDTDNSGFIDYTEFVAAACSKETILAQAHIQAAFNKLDTDNSGTISVAELAQCFDEGSDTLALSKLMQAVDTNRDGELDLQEFSRMMRNLMP